MEQIRDDRGGIGAWVKWMKNIKRYKLSVKK